MSKEDDQFLYLLNTARQSRTQQLIYIVTGFQHQYVLMEEKNCIQIEKQNTEWISGYSFCKNVTCLSISGSSIQWSDAVFPLFI